MSSAPIDAAAAPAGKLLHNLNPEQLAAVTLGGTTNYDAAIATGETAFTSTGKLASGQNVAYFLSDGVPNAGTALDTADETAWKAFLTANHITSYALGMGAAASQGPLNPIAYDGLNNTNLDAKVISDFSQLSSALQATIPQSASGDILSGGLLGGSSGFGADGLPTSVQIVGKWGAETDVLRLGGFLEQVRPWAQHRPPA